MAASVRLGVLLVAVLIMMALVLGVDIRASDIWKLSRRLPKSTEHASASAGRTWCFFSHTIKAGIGFGIQTFQVPQTRCQLK